MRSLTSGAALLCAVVLTGMMVAGCTAGHSQVKRDYRNTTAGDSGKDSQYDEETNEFEDAGSGRKAAANKKDTGYADENSSGGDADSSYRKEKYYQTGMASWYGREFQGKRTASGDTFDMNGLSAAHKTLPFGTVVKVKNFDTGKSVTVKINDRGPYRGNRIIDLSYGAAKKIGMLKNGKSHVGIIIVKRGGGDDDSEVDEKDGNNLEAVSGDDGDESTTGYQGKFSLQTGAFYSRRNAENLKSRLEGLTENTVSIIHDGDLYKVRIENLSSRKDVGRLKKTLSGQDIPSYVIHKSE